MDKERESKFTFTFTWTIENYFTGFKKVGESIKSPNFVVECLEDNEFYVNLYPMGDSQNVKGYISCFLWRSYISKVVSEEDIDYKLEIIDVNHKVCFSTPLVFIKSLDFSGSSQTVKLSQLMGEMDCITFTVRLVITHKNVQQESKKECIARSKFVLERYCMVWDVKNDTAVLRRNFCFHKGNFEVIVDIPKNYFEIAAKGTLPLPYMYCKISLLNNEGVIKAIKTVVFVFVENNNTLQIPAFNPKDLLSSKESLENNIFTIICDFFFSNGTLSSTVEYIEYITPVSIIRHSTTLCDDFQRMYVDKIFTDVEFRIDNTSLTAHKNVLSVRSPVFRAMFNQNMTEKETGVVDIKDVNAEIFNEFLMYLYSGTLDNLDCERALKLAILGDKYQVTPLLAKCREYLASNISDDNVLEILLTADAIQQRQLKKSAVNYIKLQTKNILKSDEWQQCIKNNIQVATEVLTQLTSDLNNYF